MTISTGVRFFLTGYLLWIVWHHSHWSVALMLTLCVLAVECIRFILKEITEALRLLKGRLTK